MAQVLNLRNKFEISTWQPYFRANSNISDSTRSFLRPKELTYQFSGICICQIRCGKISFFIIHYFPNSNLSTISANHALSKSKILLRFDPPCLCERKIKIDCCSGARFGKLLKWWPGVWEDRWAGFTLRL